MFARAHFALSWFVRAVIGLTLIAAGVPLSGCATWNVERPNFQLPQGRLPSNAIVCETAFVQWDSHGADTTDLCQAIDEQVLSPEVRTRLAENGLRVGVIDGPLPEELLSKLSATADPSATLTAQNLPVGAEILSQREQRQCRDGIREEIEVLPQNSQRTVVLLSDEGRVRAEQFEQPRGIFATTAFPSGDGRVRVEIIPAIDHGDMRQRVVGNPGGFRFDSRRDQRLFENLAISLSLKPSQTLVITSTPEARGLGATFFANRFSSASERLFLLMRLSRSQRDDLFSDGAQTSPLVTQLE